MKNQNISAKEYIHKNPISENEILKIFQVTHKKTGKKKRKKKQNKNKTKKKKRKK